MGDPSWRRKLSAAISHSGGLSRVAGKAQVDVSNLAKFLKAGTSLSEQKLAKVQAVLGRPGGQVDPYEVVFLTPKAADRTLGLALEFYMPEGATLAHADRTGEVFARFKKLLTVDLTPEIYAARDNAGARIVILLPSGLNLPRDLWSGSSAMFTWESATFNEAVLDIADPRPWLSQELTAKAFDAAWPSSEVNFTSQDLLDTVKRLGLSYEVAIRRLTHWRGP